ncbi:hypothetical protein M758_9G095300 [Ceratodon purpureus]|nr:hypothetical protein M758_9G095300 [Ceratodon purpureus]
MFLICASNKYVPEYRPPFKEKASRCINGCRVRGNFALVQKSLSRCLKIPFYKIIIYIHIQHLIGLPVALRHR